jgi:arylsulfatase A-like enzyme
MLCIVGSRSVTFTIFRDPIIALRRAAMVVCACSLFGLPGTANAETRPNIVLIMTDDLDTGSIQTMIDAGMMPNLQQYVIERGATFSQSFAVNGHGCPSRQTLFQGRYAHNSGSGPGVCSVENFDDSSTLATWLRTAGYRTALVGRYLDGYGYMDINRDGTVNLDDARYIPPGWDNWQAIVFSGIPPKTAVQWYENANMYNYNMNDHGQLIDYGTGPAVYQTDVIANRAVNYISGAASGSTPFFLMVAGTAPHVETSPDPRTINEYQDAWRWDIRPAQRHLNSVAFQLPRPPSFNESNDDIGDKPLWVQALPLLTGQDISNLTQQYRNRLASLRAVDDLVGGLCRALTDAGEFENTVILITSDNGWHYGQHRLSHKRTAYEEAIRVPLFISSGGKKTVAALVTNVDLAPTIVDLAGIGQGRRMDGVSFLPLLKQPDLPWRKRFLLENDSLNPMGVFAVPPYSGIRTGPNALQTPNECYVMYTNGEVEFYDLAIDPYAQTSLHADPSPLRIQQRAILNQQLSSLKNCKLGSCQALEFQ